MSFEAYLRNIEARTGKTPEELKGHGSLGAHLRTTGGSMRPGGSNVGGVRSRIALAKRRRIWR